MPEAAVGLFFATLLVWVPALWVYFDAEERGHSAFLWGGLALIPFWNVLVLVGYFFTRSRSSRPVSAPYSRSRIYLNVAVVTFWGLLAVAAATAIFGALDYLRTETPPPRFEPPRGDQLRERLAFAVALLVLAAPALGAHLVLWSRQRGASAGDAEVRRAWARLEQGLFSVVVVLSGLIATFGVVGLVFEGAARLFDVVTNVDTEFSSVLVSMLVPSAASLALVYAAFWIDPAYQRRRAEVRASPRPAATPEPAPAAAPPAAPAGGNLEAGAARYCAQCGQALAAGARFCPACGTAVA